MKSKTANCCYAAILSIVIWSILASSLWCYWSKVCIPGEWYFIQWWFELPFWRANWYVTMLVIGSASVATGFITFVLIAVSLLLRPKDRQPNLWGSSDFADRREMVSGGIKNRKSPF